MWLQKAFHHQQNRNRPWDLLLFNEIYSKKKMSWCRIVLPIQNANLLDVFTIFRQSHQKLRLSTFAHHECPMDRGPTERKLYDLFQRFFALNVPILASTGINMHHKTEGLTTNKNVGILESLRGLSGNMLYVRRRGTHMDQADHVQDATYWSDEHLDPNDGKTVNSLWRLEAILKLGSPSFRRVWCLKTSNTYHTLKNNTLSSLQKKNLWSQMILHFIHHQKTFTPSHLVCCNAASVFLIKDFKDHPQLLLVEGDDVVPRIGWDVLNLAGAADGAAT